VFETILSGVLVFVIGQLVLKLVIDPVHALKGVFAEISQGLLVNTPFIYNPTVLNDEQRGIVKDRMLALAAHLRAKLMLVPAYAFWGYVFRLPSKTRIHEAAQDLVAIGNWVYSSNNAVHVHIIKHVQNASDILGIYIPESSRVSDYHLQAAIEASFGRRADAQQGAAPDPRRP
jgi:hypothetical protein